MLQLSRGMARVMARDGTPSTNVAGVHGWVLKGAPRSRMFCRQDDSQLPWTHVATAFMPWP